MKKNCTIELFQGGSWHEVASVSLTSNVDDGWRANSTIAYGDQWALTHAGARDAWALSSTLPVSLNFLSQPHWPVFLMDLLPQGFGRRELLKQLNLPETTGPSGDWPLLITGAGNPTGHLRIKEAAAWLQERKSPMRGFSDEEIARRSASFMEYLATHGFFVAGSSGIQGEWPKILLTRAKDSLLYLDHTLPDCEAEAHFIVKFRRGEDPAMAQILRHEANYMAIARHIGLRVHAPLTLQNTALFIPRFDRKVSAAGVERLGQESIATMMNLPGFGIAPSHETVCQGIMAICSNPVQEICEYLKRDLANVAFGNKDNHARNTALTRNFSGYIGLTPLFDFAPMYLHPEGIARSMRWQMGDRGSPRWIEVINCISTLCEINRQILVDALVNMKAPLQDVWKQGREFGLEEDVYAFLKPGIQDIIQQLEILN